MAVERLRMAATVIAKTVGGIVTAQKRLRLVRSKQEMAVYIILIVLRPALQELRQ